MTRLVPEDNPYNLDDDGLFSECPEDFLKGLAWAVFFSVIILAILAAFGRLAWELARSNPGPPLRGGDATRRAGSQPGRPPATIREFDS